MSMNNIAMADALFGIFGMKRVEMKKGYLVGMCQDRLLLENGYRAIAIDKGLGVIGLCPVFNNKRKAQDFAKGTAFPVITMAIGKKAIE